MTASVSLELSTAELVPFLSAIAAGAVLEITARETARQSADEHTAAGRTFDAAEDQSDAARHQQNLDHIEKVAAKLPGYCFDIYRDFVASRCRSAGLLV